MKALLSKSIVKHLLVIIVGGIVVATVVFMFVVAGVVESEKQTNN